MNQPTKFKRTVKLIAVAAGSERLADTIYVVAGDDTIWTKSMTGSDMHGDSEWRQIASLPDEVRPVPPITPRVPPEHK